MSSPDLRLTMRCGRGTLVVDGKSIPQNFKGIFAWNIPVKCLDGRTVYVTDYEPITGKITPHYTNIREVEVCRLLNAKLGIDDSGNRLDEPQPELTSDPMVEPIPEAPPEPIYTEPPEPSYEEPVIDKPYTGTHARMLPIPILFYALLSLRKKLIKEYIHKKLHPML